MFMAGSWRFFVIQCVCLMTCCLVASQESLVLIEGNVTLAAMMEINDAEEGACGDYDVYSIQELVAVTWFLDAVNDIGYIPGVKIGLDAYRTCKLPEKAAQSTVTLLDKYQTGQANSQRSDLLFGMIGPGRTAEAVAVSGLISYLPTNQRVMQISGSSTGKQLQDRSKHSNFFRVIPPDNVQVEVIMQLLLQLEWNYVGIVYDNDDYGRSAAEELRRLLKERQVCVPVFTSLPLDPRSTAFTAVGNQIVEQLKASDSGVVRGLVVLAGTSTTSLLVQILNKQITFTQLVLSEAVGLNQAALTSATANTVMLLARGALTTSPPYTSVPNFARFWSELWRDKTNFTMFAQRLPWLESYFKQVVECELKSSSCWEDNSDKRRSQEISESNMSLYISYQLRAVAVMASLLKTLHTEKCGPTEHTVCPALRNSIQGREDVLDMMQHTNISLTDFVPISSSFGGLTSLSFDGSGDVINRGDDVKYTVHNLKGNGGGYAFTQVGTFKNHQLTMNTNQTEFYDEDGASLSWDQLPPAQCQVGHDCLTCASDVSENVTFIEGDFYVIGLVPVSEKNSGDLLGCGEVKGLVGADLAQGIVFAVEQVNEKRLQFRNFLPGRRVGLIVINTCGSPLHVRQKLMDFYAGKLALPDGRTSSAVRGQVMGVVGAFYSANSIASSDTLTDLDTSFVQVSPGSTSPDLSDRNKHPSFVRLVPADDTQAKVMLDIVERLGANYIQVIYDSSTAYATALYNKLQEEVTSTSNGRTVCIAQSIANTPKADVSQYKYIVDKLRDKSAARVVVVVLHAVEVNKLMDAILPLLTSDDNFLFLGSETWGRREDIIQGRTRLQGSLVLAQEIAVDKPFEEYFTAVDLSTTANPWLSHFWEAKFKCYLNKSFKRKGKTGPCRENFADEYKQDALVPFYIQSTYALVKGFGAALTETCGSEAKTKCEALTSSKLVSAMHDVRLDLYSQGRYNPVFDGNGDGLVGYRVLQVSLSSSGNDVIYKDVGDWTQAGLTLNKSELSLPGGAMFTSLCPNSLECDKCSKRADTANTGKQGDTGYPLDTVIGVAAGCGLLIIILIIIIIVVVRRKSHPEPLSPTGSHFPLQERPDDSSAGQINPYATPEEISNDIQKMDGASGFRSPQIPSRPSDLYLNPITPSGLGVEFVNYGR
ncbi:hypothetical protein V1264_003878 [Littorina saxatilis]